MPEHSLEKAHQNVFGIQLFFQSKMSLLLLVIPRTKYCGKILAKLLRGFTNIILITIIYGAHRRYIIDSPAEELGRVIFTISPGTAPIHRAIGST